jgi:hypothetical protein
VIAGVIGEDTFGIGEIGVSTRWLVLAVGEVEGSSFNVGAAGSAKTILCILNFLEFSDDIYINLHRRIRDSSILTSFGIRLA